jgi:hypothetical protein
MIQHPLRVLRHPVKTALLAVMMVAPARETLSATITVHEPDSEGRVFVDVVGQINDEDFKTFKEKTDQVLPIGVGHLKKQMVVALISYGGNISSALQIGDQIHRRGMSTFVPGDRTCASACALIWLAGRQRHVGDTPQIGFHAIHDTRTQRESGIGNALVGAYLRDLGIDYKAIVFMTRAGPTSVEWLTPDVAKELGVAWTTLQPPRAIPIPLQPELQPPPPPQVIAAWTNWARTLAPQRLPAATPPATPNLLPMARPVITSPEPAPPPDPDAEARAYQSAERVGSKKAWEDFLATYPFGLRAREAHFKRGQLYARNGDFSRAAQDYDEVIRLEPRDAVALNNRCWARVMIGELRPALEDCDAALEIRLGYVDALDSRGLINLKLGQLNNAIADYDAALRINPKYASSLYGRGIAKLRIGNAHDGNGDIAAAKLIQRDIVDEFASYGIR